MDVGTKWVHVCEGAVRYPVGWVQDCDIVKNNMLMYAIDVLT